MKINIIGGSGFIGTRLATIFNKKNVAFSIVDKVIGASFPTLTHNVDIRSLEALRASIDLNAVVINLAAEHRDDVSPPCLYDEVNIEGARNICKIANKMAVNRIIFTSSVAVYGFAPLGTNESGVIAPFNDYGRSKWEAEQVYKQWQAEDPQNRTLVIVRPTVVFGERNRGNVFNLLKQIASGKFVMVGDGLNR
jgi:nucleoside-diphosphate-sugar epimerase